MFQIVEKARVELKAAYAKLDGIVERELAAGNIAVTCKRGCYSCCRIIAAISLVEGLLLADKVLHMPKRQRLELIRRLKDSCADADTSINDYANMGHHCGFLDMATKDCTIYEDRPAACRYHYVGSPPELCRPGKVKKIAQLDLLDMENAVQALSAKLTGHIIAAPLPNIVLHCMYILDPTKKKTVAGVAHPLDWLENMLNQRKEELIEMKNEIEAARAPR